MATAATASEALRQVRDGMDFSAPKSVLKIRAERAVVRARGWPYSSAENVAHCDLWQQIWLAKLRGETRPRLDPKIWDWPKVHTSEWGKVREDFLRNLGDALAIASAEPFVHRMKSDEDAVKTLLEIAVHDAYHIGQCVLLKRLLE
ncbi:MAG TPA: DinB family protein [Fimbriimonas sp.]